VVISLISYTTLVAAFAACLLAPRGAACAANVTRGRRALAIVDSSLIKMKNEAPRRGSRAGPHSRFWR
jgi:hypothetical protein